MKKIPFFAISFLMWCALTWAPGPLDLFFGAVTSAVLAFIFGELFYVDYGLALRPRRLLLLLYYIMLFFINFTVASVRVLLQVLNPKFSVKPGIVRLPTTLKEDTEVTIVLNSITFSPDTLAMDFEDGHMYVYWLNVTKKDVRGTAGLILRKPEKIIKGVLG